MISRQISATKRSSLSSSDFSSGGSTSRIRSWTSRKSFGLSRGKINLAPIERQERVIVNGRMLGLQPIAYLLQQRQHLRAAADDDVIRIDDDGYTHESLHDDRFRPAWKICG